MRQMKNVRTGSIAAYDEELVQSGRWVEVTKDAEPSLTPEKKPAKKAVKLQQFKATGTLDVQPSTDK